MTDYRPVDCDTHSRYEEAILLKRRLRLRWQAPGGQVCEEMVVPVDVLTQNREEFLIVRTSENEELRLRLDRILDSESV